jgi:ABC-2 type transport system ATP-binding protein
MGFEMSARLTADPILEAHSLTKQYRGRSVPALDGVELAVPAGAVVGLVGPNGAGKSTLLRSWMGFERPTTGSVRVLGLDPFVDAPAVVRQVAYLAQDVRLYRDLTVVDHLALAEHYRADTFDRARALERLRALSIPVDARAGTLSGGQAAQVGLAIAIGLRARVLLLDEPLANLDPLARREFMDVMIADVKDTGATAVLSSHVIADIAHACDLVAILGGGKALLVDTIEHARSVHVVVEPADINGMTVVAALPGSAGVLVRHHGDSSNGFGPADLESIVMGYLAAGRA